MTCRRVIASLSPVLALAVAFAPDARSQTGAVEGLARSELSEAPVQFALVRLVRPDSSPLPSDGPPQGMTNASGRYRLGDVAPGRYRVQLLRIGFFPVFSDPVQVAPGETVEVALRVASQPVLLPPVTVTADACVAAKELERHPQIQTLWQQARAGASVRAELMARFRYRVRTHEAAVERAAVPGGGVDQNWISDPKSAVKNAERRRSERLSRGYYGQTTKDGMVSFYLPDELDVLHEDFLKGHCLVPTAQYGAGEVGLRFSPLRIRRNVLDVGGTIWLDSASFLARRIDLEYVDGDDQRGNVRLDFADVPVAGGTLRMPIGGDINLRPSRTDPARRSESRFTITYSEFVEVPRR